ncbi:HU family DNA-binding protein [Alloprevotella sp. Lung230]|jgi:putative DNA-binding protein|uniref:HU family DNA-binding protein n=1 Tax=Alloprevotella sp. Lung230 TaxID=2766595 RepID=UPI00165601BC|nr:HU family DNA-binding protein [Alloprevotella sp. Lung230]MBC8626229.1 HU family DNA-binding protein [Alloprevotella sp. Lung230]
MIKYVIRAKKNPLKKDVVKYYPQMAPTSPLTLDQIIKRVEKRSTVSSADVKAVLDALQYEVMEALASGSTVRLGDLGSFRLTMKSEGAETAAEAKRKGAQLIKRVNVQFTKSTTMRDTLSVHLLDSGATPRTARRH